MKKHNSKAIQYGTEILEGKETIIIGNVEYETESHQLGKNFMDIIIPAGWRLWRPSECYLLWENENTRKQFNLHKAYFFVQQMIKKYQGKSVAWFYAGAGGTDLGCGGDPRGSDSALGVRFCRDLKGRGRSKKK